MSTNPNTLSMPTSTAPAQAAAAQSPTTRKAIASNFREVTKDPKKLDEAANQLYESLLEDAVTGIFIEVHHLRKTGNLSALDGVPEESTHRICEVPNLDIFGVSTAKKAIDCTCPNCDRLVAAARFAPHLEKCMGMGRISSRIASRRLATKEGSSASSNSSYVHSGANTGGTDDEDDVDWSSDKRKKKSTQNSRNNGSKKNNGKTF